MSPRKAPNRNDGTINNSTNRIVIDEDELLVSDAGNESQTIAGETATETVQTPVEADGIETINEDQLKAEAKQKKKQKRSKNTKNGSPKAQKTDQKGKKAKKPRTKKQKIILGVLIAVVVILAIVLGVLVYLLLQKPNEHDISREEFPDPIYSVLTGEEIDNEALNSNPTYCVQIPNGNDGGRPQAGLTHAGVVFEAIAEANITRFAAVFQNAETSAIGPVRSLRPYYLDWDTPFDCTVVHAGGSDEAISALRAGGQRDMNENLTYMWREQGSGRGWNNLFTSPAKIAEFNAANGYHTSKVSAFPRYTPDEIDELLHARRATTTETATPEAAENSAETTNTDNENADYETAQTIHLNLGNIRMFNVVYTYDAETNSYPRSYANGETHLVYDCPAGLSEPQTTTACGNLVQVAPKAIAAIVVKEGKMADNYHEDIKTLGNGTAYIFQNGEAIEGTWSKSSQDSQIIFRDQTGNEIKFTPGQLWITAVPEYGTVTWE